MLTLRSEETTILEDQESTNPTVERTENNKPVEIIIHLTHDGDAHASE